MSIAKIEFINCKKLAYVNVKHELVSSSDIVPFQKKKKKNNKLASIIIYKEYTKILSTSASIAYKISGFIVNWTEQEKLGLCIYINTYDIYFVVCTLYLSYFDYVSDDIDYIIRNTSCIQWLRYSVKGHHIYSVMVCFFKFMTLSYIWYQLNKIMHMIKKFFC